MLNSQEAHPLEINFSTEDVTQRDRLEHWREAFARTIANMDWYPLTDTPFQQRAKVRGLPGLGIVAGTHTSTGFFARRTPELISAGTDHLVLNIQLEGRFILSQLGRETTVGPGEAVLASSADVATVTLMPNSRFIALSVPRQKFAPMVHQAQSHVGVLVPSDSEPLTLLRNYTLAMLNSDPIVNPLLQERAVAHIYDLVALAFDARPEVAAHAQQRGQRAARLLSIKSDILDNLGDGELRESVIANRHGVTPRYVRMLFEAEGTTFSDFVRRTRLTRAHQILTDRRNRDRTIGSVAYEVGFNDLSHFNRLFRRLYGGRPSEIRARR
jgi:AraC-like DNA-binding protein